MPAAHTGESSELGTHRAHSITAAPWLLRLLRPLRLLRLLRLMPGQHDRPTPVIGTLRLRLASAAHPSAARAHCTCGPWGSAAAEVDGHPLEMKEAVNDL
jgi:hypothetical protein